MTRAVLGTAQFLTKQQTSIARRHLTGDVPGEHAELIQAPSSRQTTARRGSGEGSQEGRSRSLVRGPGVHFGS